MDQGTGNEEGYGLPTVNKGSAGEAANAPAGVTPPGTGQPPDRRLTPALSAGHEYASGQRPREGPVRRPAKTSVKVSAPRFAAVSREDPVKLARAPSVRLPDQQAAKPSPAVETVPGAHAGVEQRPGGSGAPPAAETPFGSTKLFFGYLWEGSSFPVQQAQGGPGAMQDGARGFVNGTSHGSSLTQRGFPLQIPPPHSGVGLMMGGAASGTSFSGGGAPLLAVIFCCLCAVLWRGRSRAYGALLRRGTVPRLALERPG